MSRRYAPIPLGILLAISILFGSFSAFAESGDPFGIRLGASRIQQGKTFKVECFEENKNIKQVSLKFRDSVVSLSRISAADQISAWRAFVGIDVRTPVGTHEVIVIVEREGEAVLPFLPRPLERQEYRSRIQVLPGNFPVQRVKLPPKASKLLDPKLLKHDQDRLEAAMVSRVAGDGDGATATPELLNGPFQVPLSKYILTTRFGEHRIFNGQEFGFHRGLDMAAPTGTPVKSALPGTVVLSEKLYAHGHSVMISHGEGVFTLYVHMSKRDAAVGDVVERGQIIGKVGSTGISSGPHLHLGMMVHGVRVDPMQWMKGNLLTP